MNELIANPFGAAQKTDLANAVAHSDSDRAVEEVRAAMVIAKKFPRNQIEAVDRILNSCTRPTLANSALYSYPKGGQEVTGPSIRLAETLAQEWGNMQFGIRELSSSNKMSSVEAFAWDMERNVRQTKTFQVGHTRFSGGTLKDLKDPRDIYEQVANQGARRLRACILGVIPGDIVEIAVQQCEKTQKNTVEVTAETIKAMLDAFSANFDLAQELIEKRLGKRAEAINASQLLQLRKIYQSLKDGMSKPSDWFDIAEEVQAPKTSTIPIDQLRAKKAGKEPEQPAQE